MCPSSCTHQSLRRPLLLLLLLLLLHLTLLLLHLTLPQMLLEAFDGIVVAGNFVHRFRDELPACEIHRILLHAATVDDIAKMQHERTLRSSDCRRGFQPQLVRRITVLVAEMRVSDDDERERRRRGVLSAEAFRTQHERACTEGGDEMAAVHAAECNQRSFMLARFISAAYFLPP